MIASRPSNTGVGKLTNTFFEQRKHLTASIELRKKYIESAYLNQMKNEREMIQSRIEKMHFGVRKAFLEQRLQKLNEELTSKER
jgi:hypothetical protein